MRLIDAKAFDLRVSQKKMTEVFPNWKELHMEVQDAVCKHAQYLHMLLETQHTVDAVEVVRCKDCKHWRDSWVGPDGKSEHGYCHMEESDDLVVGRWSDDFCSYGERGSEHEI